MKPFDGVIYYEDLEVLRRFGVHQPFVRQYIFQEIAAKCKRTARVRNRRCIYCNKPVPNTVWRVQTIETKRVEFTHSYCTYKVYGDEKRKRYQRKYSND